MRTMGTIARGIITPIIKEGDDLVQIIVDAVIKSTKHGNYELNDKDVLGITESLVARAQGNFIPISDITEDINRLFPGDIGLVFPILSRNRFALILKAIAMTGKKVYLFLNYPSDELGNHLMDPEKMYEKNINPYADILTEKEYRDLFGEKVSHLYTGVDYIELYRSYFEDDKVEIYLTNNPRVALDYTEDILVSNVHERMRVKEILISAGGNRVLTLDDVMAKPISGEGYNAEYGLLGSNMTTENSLKLFPRDCKKIVNEIQKALKDRTGKNIEVMVFGDGAFKDPRGRIWELADPVVSPGYTPGLEGLSNEIKLKHIADCQIDNIGSEEIVDYVRNKIKTKNNDSLDKDEAVGTTPRQLTDLLGSLCDLTSGSGDKGTPIVLVQGYFDNFASD